MAEDFKKRLGFVILKDGSYVLLDPISDDNNNHNFHYVSLQNFIKKYHPDELNDALKSTYCHTIAALMSIHGDVVMLNAYKHNKGILYIPNEETEYQKDSLELLSDTLSEMHIEGASYESVVEVYCDRKYIDLRPFNSFNSYEEYKNKAKGR